MHIKYLFKKMKDVKVGDMLQVFPMGIAFLLIPFFKKEYKDTWLICETYNEARDNGYWFFKKMRENHPEQKCIYAINKKSVDYHKVSDIGETVQSRSILHWIIYFTCEYHISSQKGDGKPNAALCAFVELNNLYEIHNIFLQHGVIINQTDWLFADRSRFDMFVTSTVPETEYIRQNYGYEPEVIQLCGMPRFDNLHEKVAKKDRIVVMPTWRSWFNLSSQKQKGLTKNFKKSSYYKGWKSFLESDKLNFLITKYNLEIIFFMHRNIQYHLDDFQNSVRTKVKFASWRKQDIQELLISSQMLITDYSSVFFDMIYMKKPILFYQFDLDEFRKGQYKEGYFKYDDNPFGKSFQELELLLDELQIMVKTGFKCSEEYMKAHKQYFTYYDNQNSERVYEKIKSIKKV